MDYYETSRHDYIQKQMYPNDHRVDFFPKGTLAPSQVKIVPKPECIPKFVSKIEGNAVEEGERVYFEGIIDAQPHPVFSWYFNDEPVEPGQPGWEDAEIHDSRKMSTLIIKYVREFHMGKYTLVAENQLGHAVSNCDLIVRKKQFPPVFWQRLYNYEAEAGSRLVAEVEVGGWPVPSVTWYKEDEVLSTKTHTENYNGYFNAYVPDSRIEVIRLDQIRHCVIFHRIGESDSGVYSVQAVNPLGEAVCEAEFLIVPGEGGSGDLYIPDKWKNGNRLDWLKEDQRPKRFEGVSDPGLSDEERAAMFQRFAKPLPRALEYLASLPDYYPKPFETLPQVPFKPDAHDVRKGQQGGKPTRPSKFVAGQISHTGYVSDAGGRILPCWANVQDPNAPDPLKMNYGPVRPDLKEPRPQPPYVEGPPGPPVWESKETIEALYRMLDTVGCKLEINLLDMEKKKKDQKKGNDGRSYMQMQSNENTTKKQANTQQSSKVKKFSYLEGGNQADPHPESHIPWKQKLDKNVSGAQENAGDFTKQFMQEMYGASGTTTVQHEESKATATQSVDEHYEEMLQYAQQQERQEELRLHEQQQQTVVAAAAPALPPKTKIMFSPSRHLFSPSESVDDSDTTSVNTVEYVPVKEKVKMIAQQQEEIVRREEQRKLKEGPAGGVRILPPSPVTVRKETSYHEMTSTQSSTTTTQQQAQQQHRQVHFQEDQSVQMNKKHQELQAHIQQQMVEQQQLEAEQQQKLKQQQLEQQRLKQLEQQKIKQQQLEQQRQEQQRQQQLALQEQQRQQQLAQQQQRQQQLAQQEQQRQQQLAQQEQQRQQQLAQQQEMAQQKSAHAIFQQSCQQGQITKSDSAVSAVSTSEEMMYEAVAQVSSSSTAQVVSMSSSTTQQQHQESSASSVMIPRLEDKYDISSGLDELVANETHSEASYSSNQQSSISSRMTSQYSSMSSAASTMVSSKQQSIASSKTMKDSSYSTATSSAVGSVVAQPIGYNTEKPSDEVAAAAAVPSWVRSNVEDSSAPSKIQYGSPSLMRRKVNQSPAPSIASDSDGPTKYRTPPSTPFQPGFYKAPPLDDPSQTNPFPLSPRTARSSRITKVKSSDSISSTNSKKLRRKQIEEQRGAHHAAGSDSEDEHEELL